MQETTINSRGFAPKADVEKAIAAGRKAVTTWSKRRAIELVTTTQKEFVEATGLEELPEPHFGGVCMVEQGETRKDEKAFVYFDAKFAEDDDAKLVAFTHTLTHALTGATTGHNYTWRRQHVRVLVAAGLAMGRDEDELIELAAKVAQLNVDEFYNHWDREEDEEVAWLAEEAVKAARRINPLDDETEELIEELVNAEA